MKSFSFTKNSTLVNLIYINVGIFLFTNLLEIGFTLFNLDSFNFLKYLHLTAQTDLLIRQPWSMLTYMFLHTDVLHLFFNMICLYGFGKLFLNYFSQKQLVGLYLLGGIGAGICFICAYNFFPFFANSINKSYLLGASGSIMAIILAIAFYIPNLEVQLFLIGKIKLKWIAIAMVAISIYNTTSSNAGGEFAHIGGALVGMLYIYLYKRGKDIVGPINKLIDRITTLFRSKPKIKFSKQPKTDAFYNQQRNADNQTLDLILDKIKKSGYSSLSEEEKKQLFDTSNRL
ncbi:MAG: rhomboid family intramembrane serine protease [Paludibacteraceae bacterium]|nr:rhomboid family intramembrane serine protease [Paludibacteraceae bacterium]